VLKADCFSISGHILQFLWSGASSFAPLSLTGSSRKSSVDDIRRWKLAIAEKIDSPQMPMFFAAFASGLHNGQLNVCANDRWIDGSELSNVEVAWRPFQPGIRLMPSRLKDCLHWPKYPTADLTGYRVSRNGWIGIGRKCLNDGREALGNKIWLGALWLS